MFAGIGGFRSGLSHYGDFFVPVGYCEIDPYAKRAYYLSRKQTQKLLSKGLAGVRVIGFTPATD